MKSDGTKKRIFVVLVLIIVLLVTISISILMMGISELRTERDALQKELEESKNNTVSKEEYDDLAGEWEELRKKVSEYETSQTNGTGTENSSEDEETKEVSEHKPPEDGAIVGVGETFTVNGLRITADSVDLEYYTYKPIYDDPVYMNGKKFVGVSFTIENVGDSKDFISTADFDCYADDTICDDADFYNGNMGDLSPGRKTSFTEFWEVPQNAVNIECEYPYRADGIDKFVKIKIK